jgi:hypothetical protein
VTRGARLASTHIRAQTLYCFHISMTVTQTLVRQGFLSAFSSTHCCLNSRLCQGASGQGSGSGRCISAMDVWKNHSYITACYCWLQGCVNTATDSQLLQGRMPTPLWGAFPYPHLQEKTKITDQDSLPTLLEAHMPAKSFRTDAHTYMMAQSPCRASILH